jgi:transglutaminase-like putative cysteine protease
VKVGALPAGARAARIWVPLPQSDECQTISNLKVEAPVPHQETREPLHGNRLAYLEVAGPAPAGIPVRVSFDDHRQEVQSIKCQQSAELAARLLQGDRLAPIEGEPAARAAQAAAKLGSVDAKARAIYDRVLGDVDYDKSGQGWGRGDIAYVCDVGKGNCSDFHALFIGMARAQGIPSFFEIGFPIPEDKPEGAVGGYHCWAWYQGKDGAWHPVDASEADKAPVRTDYFFGTICANRIAFTRGRDLVLEPRQAGQPVNFLIYPYVEVDGKPVEVAEKKFSFRDLGS